MQKIRNLSPPPPSIALGALAALLMMSTAAAAQTVTMTVEDLSSTRSATYSGSSCTGGPCPSSFPSTSAGGTTTAFSATSTSGDVISMIAYYGYNKGATTYTCQFTASEMMSASTGACTTLAVSYVPSAGNGTYPQCGKVSQTTTSTTSQPCTLNVTFSIYGK